ncbi:hypothetical protein MHH52_12965 [Paenibacillus sp. FSL K6-0276]
MISNQQSLNLSPFMAIYDIVVPKDNMLRQSNAPTKKDVIKREHNQKPIQ